MTPPLAPSLPPPAVLSIAVRGGALRGEAFVPDRCRGVVVVTHGYAEHSGRYGELCAVLVASGFAVVRYDVRGHGRSFGARGYVDRFTRYVDDLDAVLARAAPLFPLRLPLVLLGHSNGGLVTLAALLADRPIAVAGAVLSSPFLALRTPLPWSRRLVAHVASVVWPSLSLPNRLRPEYLTTDPERQDARRADLLCNSRANARWFTTTRRCQRDVAARAHALPCPTLWLLGGDDPLADPDRSRAVAARVTRAEVLVFPGMRHEVFQERERAAVFQAVVGWLDRLAAGAAPVGPR